VANKRQVRRSIKQLQRIKTWQLVILLILVGFIAATFLRLNNIGMTQRRTAVLDADKAGEQTALKGRLLDLQRYVSSHMNASMGTIYLEEQYKRDSEKANQAAASDDNPNGNIFKKAQDICAPRFKHLGNFSTAYKQCVLDELAKYPAASELTTSLKLPKADAYRHSFSSPLWSPDFAGFSVLACFFIVFIIMARLVGLVVLRIILKSRHSSI